jgi:carbon-monoxide dehydrogenase small subunit
MPELRMILNGKEVSTEVAPDDMLAHVLRENFGLIGTKIGCGEGECGACTVLLDGTAIMSCIFPALRANDHEVLTIEGLSGDGELDVIQQAFIDCTASQCGYCTPGMVMAAKALLDTNPNPTREDIEEGISGNLCRCTGYYQIIQAIQLAAQRLNGTGEDSDA